MASAKIGKTTCIKETAKAILVSGGVIKGEIWIPKSVVHDDSEVYDSDRHADGELVVQEWWAEANGLA